MKIQVPELALVLLIGPSGSGKSTFARRHFKTTEILSSDFFRGMVSDDENDQSVSGAAFELLHLACAKRLGAGRFTVIDATNLQASSRKPFLEMARRYHVPAIVIMLDLPEEVCQSHDEQRPERHVGTKVIQSHLQHLRQVLAALPNEGFRTVYHLTSTDQINSVTIEREKAVTNRREIRGPLDIIGDVHGCLEELKQLLLKLGYALVPTLDIDGRPTWDVLPPQGHRVIFVGDLVDRGPDTPGVLRLAMRMIAAGNALCVLGNHDDKLLRKLHGRDVTISHGLEESLNQLEKEPPSFATRARDFLDQLPTHYVLDDGQLVVAHAGLASYLQGKDSERVRAFCLFGDTNGERDAEGLPIRLNWAADYHGKAKVVYGHVAIQKPEWVNGTLCIDTACVFGGNLTALRYPETNWISVPAIRKYAEPRRALPPTIHEALVPKEKALPKEG